MLEGAAMCEQPCRTKEELRFVRTMSAVALDHGMR